LLASISHDLRTPLTTITALAQAGARRGDQNALAIEEQAGRLSRLVTDLLDMSRLKGGALPFKVELNTAEDLVGAAVRQVRGLVQERTVETQVDFDQPALAGRFDFVQSLRVLSNLLENALRYSPHSSPVQISIQREGSTLVFAVADRGPGVPASERERIFEPFYRLAGAPAAGAGAGLGLAIARRLAELQGGSVEYAPRPGGGSVFVLRLPAADLSAAPDGAAGGEGL
jgi:two-component system sensor histidine kinase KdpD